MSEDQKLYGPDGPVELTITAIGTCKTCGWMWQAKSHNQMTPSVAEDMKKHIAKQHHVDTPKEVDAAPDANTVVLGKDDVEELLASERILRSALGYGNENSTPGKAIMAQINPRPKPWWEGKHVEAMDTAWGYHWMGEEQFGKLMKWVDENRPHD